MDFDEFVGQVQNRARLASNREAVSAIRATLETLADRISGNTAENLAVQLPQQIGEYLRRRAVGDHYAGDNFDLNQFMQTVADRERAPLLDAVFHARSVFDVLQQAVAPDDMEEVRAQLSKDYSSLFQSWSGVSLPPPERLRHERNSDTPR